MLSSLNRSSVVLVVLAMVLPSCHLTVDQVRATYSRQAACPEARIASVVLRPELRATDLFLQRADAQFVAEQLTPPAEIAADPARLGMWKSEKIAFLRRTWDDVPVYEVQACGKDVFLLCTAETDPRNGPASCTNVDAIARPNDPK
jgi:hypothetical protein